LRAIAITRPSARIVLMLALLLLLLGLAWRPAQASPGEEFAVKSAGVALRAEPTETAEVVMTLTPANRLVEFERRGGWVRVGVFRQVGAFGWVAAADLVPMPRAPTPAPQPAPTPEPRVPPFLLKVDGTGAIQFQGTCILVAAGGAERTVTVSGAIPRSYSFDATMVSCWVRKWDYFGRMRLRLYRQGRIVAELDTSGPYNLVWIRSNGPWGPARALLRGGLVSNPKPKR
jgi:hypothetical protein